MSPIYFQSHTLYTSLCEDSSIYTSEQISNTLDYVFNHNNLADFVDESQKGEARTTVGFKLDFSGLPEFFNIFSWVVGEISKLKNEFVGTNITFTRTWVNKIFEGCSGACHIHPSENSGVAIFYLSAPEGSSDLVIINNGVEGTPHTNYKLEDTFYLPVKTGQLVVHKPETPHAVSEHKSSEPRVCLIMEFKIT